MGWSNVRECKAGELNRIAVEGFMLSSGRTSLRCCGRGRVRRELEGGVARGC